MVLHLSPADWLSLFGHYLALSLLAIGGAVTTIPEMHRYLVGDKGWVSDPQFNASIAIAQSAPGPNVLFVPLLGWMVGLNNGSMWWALFGVLVTMVGIMLPSATLTYMAAQWGHRNRDLRSVRAFKHGMAPLTVSVLVATGWILGSAHSDPARDWPLWVMTLIATLFVAFTRVPLLWLLATGALVGWLFFSGQ
ncbi:chromate transporter [Lacisediminimonas sp.]|uniref:chromate transporter n=1 Tax=Lacisediminimonas sp. TaxID=3060582 RepID=UPI0027208DFE|nr:chromate transporter [Lacisediminimonas sp.]MDO8299576.1 chromate transporter [Lacisediminimonas sp.]